MKIPVLLGDHIIVDRWVNLPPAGSSGVAMSENKGAVMAVAASTIGKW